MKINLFNRKFELNIDVITLAIVGIVIIGCIFITNV